MITEDYVSFETAKLLKEKGFDECPLFRYDDCGQFWVQGGYDKTKKMAFPSAHSPNGDEVAERSA